MGLGKRANEATASAAGNGHLETVLLKPISSFCKSFGEHSIMLGQARQAYSQSQYGEKVLTPHALLDMASGLDYSSCVSVALRAGGYKQSI